MLEADPRDFWLRLFAMGIFTRTKKRVHVLMEDLLDETVGVGLRARVRLGVMQIGGLHTRKVDVVGVTHLVVLFCELLKVRSVTVSPFPALD